MEALGLDNIFGEQEIDGLFSDTEDSARVEESAGAEEKGETPDPKEDSDDSKTTEAVDPEDLFEDGDTKQPESVGSGKNKEGKEDSSDDKGGGTSPNQNFYSSIANAVAEDGVFPNLDEETVKKANDPESFSELFELEVQARLDEAQKRVLNALKNGVEPDSIRQFENTLNYLNSITEQQIMAESDEGENLRQRIIYQDFINKGYKAAQAQKLTQRAIDTGVDIEDAKEALQNNKDYFQEKYNDLLEEAQKKAAEDKEERKKQEAKLKDSILKDKDLLGDMEISSDIRKKVYENISRPVYKDSETGEYLTVIQKYQAEHPADFLKYVSLFYTMTGGFKDFKSLAKAEVKKEIKKGLRELEQTLNNTRRNSDGSLRVMGAKDDPESFINGNFRLALGI